MSLPPLPRSLRLRSLRLALAVAAVTGLALCLASPVVGIPGLESALVLGLVLPPFVALACARRIVEYRRSGRPLEAPEILGTATALALGVLAVPVVMLLLNLLRVPACEPFAGLAFLALGPALGVLAGAFVGTVLALLGGRGQLASTLAFFVPWVAALLGVLQFWSGPAIFVYGHFGGYFPGTLYDPDVEITGVYTTFRIVTTLWLLGLSALIAAGLDPEAGRLRLSRMRRHPGWVASAVLLLGAAVIGDLQGETLGHRSSAASIAEALGGRVQGERCVVLLPRELPRRDARRLADDCDHRVRQAERAVGVTQPRPVTAYFFRSTAEKRRLMGASRTQVAKPWRHEVYLQLGEWPHPILFHEVVHVVVGNIGRGPFRVAGPFGGWLPDPAIIEGVAVALAWDAREGLTPHQWARAMLDEGLAPPLRNVGGLAFLLQPASRAYVVSGSFVRWMRETRGPGAVRQLYLTGDWEHALGTTVAEAEREWHRYLQEEVELPDEARALARLRFERPGLFSQTCPHRVANLRTELRAALGAGDDIRAARTCRRILRIDPNHTSTRANLVGTLARLGRADDAREELARLVGPPSAAPPLIAAARLRLADALWRRGERDEAAALYRALLTEPQTDDSARQLEVRLLGLDAGGRAERALRDLLVPPRDRRGDAAIGMFQIGELSQARADGLAAYLAGRQLASRQRFALARPQLLRAQARGLPTPRLRRENERLLAIAESEAGDPVRAAQRWRAIQRRDGASVGERIEASDWLTRLRDRR